jgi:dihydrofolate reductase
MRRIRFNAAVTLDGFLAASDGSFEWIVADPAIDFAALFQTFDTIAMGRRTFEVLLREGNGGALGAC